MLTFINARASHRSECDERSDFETWAEKNTPYNFCVAAPTLTLLEFQCRKKICVPPRGL